MQDYLAQISLDQAVPADVQKQFEVAKKLCLHASFVYEFWTVSNLIALLAVESALKHRFTQYYSGRFVLQKGERVETLEGDYERARYRLERGWKLVDWHPFRPSLTALVRWASSKGLLRELEEMAKKAIPKLRNNLAHPDFQQIVPPGIALTAVLRCSQIINQLFAAQPEAKS